MMHDIIPYYDHSLSLYIYIYTYIHMYTATYTYHGLESPVNHGKPNAVLRRIRSFPDEPVAETPVLDSLQPWMCGSVRQKRAWTVISMGNHLEMIAWKWQEFKDATSNDELDLYHRHLSSGVAGTTHRSPCWEVPGEGSGRQHEP